MSNKFPRKGRPLTISIKGELSEMPPEWELGEIALINGKCYKVKRVMRRIVKGTSTGWKEYTLEPTDIVSGAWSYCPNGEYECSGCGDKTNVDEYMGVPLYDYCPRCGARMDGEKE